MVLGGILANQIDDTNAESVKYLHKALLYIIQAETIQHKLVLTQPYK